MTTTTSAPRRSLPIRLLTVVVAVAALGACSSDASTRATTTDDQTTTTAPQVELTSEIPPGTKLRIGDQLDYLQTVLGLAGEDQDFPYEVEYSTFVGGPPMLQAFQGGALDTGFIGSTPLIFAQATGQNLAAVAGWKNERGLSGLLSVDPDIDGWEDLAGKRVAYQRGTAAEASLLQALDAVGIDPDEITTVDVPIIQINATLDGGSADAAVSTEPLISLFLAGNPDARVVAIPAEITDRSSFLIADRGSLEDEAVTAALADYAARLVRSFRWINDNQSELARTVFVEQYGLTAERAEEIVAGGNGSTTFYALPGEVLDQQQKLADLFFEAGQIPTRVDVTDQFDVRFNDLITQEQGS